LAVHDVHALPTQCFSDGQVEQLDPPEPQAMSEPPDMQAPPKQQPVGHDVPSQTHAPFTHRWPLAHAGPVPQVHVPLLAQVSVVPPQVLHDPPWLPQVVSVCASQMPPLQQPPGHDVALHVHAPLTQA